MCGMSVNFNLVTKCLILPFPFKMLSQSLYLFISFPQNCVKFLLSGESIKILGWSMGNGFRVNT